MSKGSTRIRVTTKGRSLQRDTLHDPELELPLSISTRRRGFHSQVSSQDFSASGSSTCREGYFRPKHSTTLALKSQSSIRLYPNYMKQDAREYPHKHECSWVPKSTIKSEKKLEVLRPVTKTVHHSLYNARECRGMSAHPSIKDANFLVSGEHGHVTMNVTTCKYPEPRVLQKKEETEIPHYEPVNVLAPIYQELYRELQAGKKPISQLSTPFQTPRQIVGKSGHKGTLDNILAPEIRPSMNRTQSQWPSQMRLTAASSMNNLGFGYKTVTKMSEEKVEQMKNRFEDQQKAYGELLSKLNKKVQAKYAEQQECPDYLHSFDHELKAGGKELEDLAKKRDNLGTRYAERLKNHTMKKYGKFWGQWEIIGKTKKPQQLSGLLGNNNNYEEQESQLGRNDSQLSLKKDASMSLGLSMSASASGVTLVGSEKPVLRRVKTRTAIKGDRVGFY